MLYHVHCNYIGVSWNIHRRIRHLQNTNFDTEIDEFVKRAQLHEPKLISSCPSWKMAAILDFR